MATAPDPPRHAADGPDGRPGTYRDVLRPTEECGRGFLQLRLNSGLVALATVVITVGAGTLAASAAARLRFFGRRTVNMVMVLVYLFPAIVMAIPLFETIADLESAPGIMEAWLALPEVEAIAAARAQIAAREGK